MDKPAVDGFRMPAEWTPHERTWMAWPGPNHTFDCPRGLTGDHPPHGYGTLGHADTVAAFARPGVVVTHSQPDPAHPDHEASKEIIGLLKAQTEARGRRIEVVEVPAPTVLESDGHWADSSYINHYQFG